MRVTKRLLNQIAYNYDMIYSVQCSYYLRDRHSLGGTEYLCILEVQTTAIPSTMQLGV